MREGNVWSEMVKYFLWLHKFSTAKFVLANHSSPCSLPAYQPVNYLAHELKYIARLCESEITKAKELV